MKKMYHIHSTKTYSITAFKLMAGSVSKSGESIDLKNIPPNRGNAETAVSRYFDEDDEW